MACASQFVHAAMAYLRLYTAPRPDPAQLPDQSLQFLEVFDKFSDNAKKFLNTSNNTMLPAIDSTSLTVYSGGMQNVGGLSCHLNAALQALNTLYLQGCTDLNQTFQTRVAVLFHENTKEQDGENYKVYLQPTQTFKQRESKSWDKNTGQEFISYLQELGGKTLTHSPTPEEYYNGPYDDGHGNLYIVVPQHHIDFQFNLLEIIKNSETRKKFIRILKELMGYNCGRQQTDEETLQMLKNTFPGIDTPLSKYANFFTKSSKFFGIYKLVKIKYESNNLIHLLPIVQEIDNRNISFPDNLDVQNKYLNFREERSFPDGYGGLAPLSITDSNDKDILLADNKTRMKYFKTTNTNEIQKLINSDSKRRTSGGWVSEVDELKTSSPFFMVNCIRSFYISSTGQNVKVTTELVNLMQIELNTFEGPKQFKLISYNVHMGDTSSSGHYINVSLRKKEWTYFNDGANPVVLTDDDAKNWAANATMLIYQRVDAAA